MEAPIDDYGAEDPEAEGMAVEAAPAPQLSPAQALYTLMSVPNLAEVLPAEKLTEISTLVTDEYRIDEASRKPWLERNAAGLDLAMMVTGEKKTYPIDSGSANIKYPLLATAALQFNARAYPAIVPGDRVVKGKVWGHDPNGMKAARAERVAEYMSWQKIHEQPEWEEDTDRMLVILPTAGCVFRKNFYDPAVGRNTTRLITADRFVVNYWARSIEDAPRTTEKMPLYPFEIQERIRDGRFIAFEYGADKGWHRDEATSGDSQKQAKKPDEEDVDGPHLFLEQHRLLDLDDDGVSEPYIVTVHAGTNKVCRVVANFGPEQIKLLPDGGIAGLRKRDYYIKYDFIPSFDGGIYGVGFGWLLKDINEAINSTLNQISDAAHLANIQGGFISATLGKREQTIRLKMGEFRVLATTGNGRLQDSVMPMTFPGPSPVLFQLLGLLIDSGREVAAIKDVLTGETQGKSDQSGVAIMALIEQGLQVFTSIYKRIHRALKKEFIIDARLNAEFLDPEKYAQFFEPEVDPETGQPVGPPPDPQADFADEDMDISPVSDPNAVTKMQQLAKAQFVLDTALKFEGMVIVPEAIRRAFEGAGIEELDKLVVPEQPPDPEKEDLAKRLAMLEAEKGVALVAKDQSQADKTMAETDQIRLETQMTMTGEGQEQPAPPVPDTSDAIRAAEGAKLDSAERVKAADLEFQREKMDREFALREMELKLQRDLELLKLGLQQQAAVMSAAQESQRAADGEGAGPEQQPNQPDFAAIMSSMEAAMVAPKRIIRDETGRPVGVETVI